MLPLALALLLVVADSVPALPGVAVERRLAQRFALSVGDTLAIVSEPDTPARRYVVAAVYQPRPDPATALRGEYNIRFHLPDLADLLGHPDRIDRMGVGAVAGILPDSLAARLNQRAFGYRAFASEAIAAESSRTFAVVSRFHRAIGVIAIVASAVFLLCIMLLKVEERRLDAAVMRLIGISRATVVRAFVLEATLIAAVGSA
ncbi:MAG: ABC transporter permease, partial [Gemmatimonadales bacterium]